MEDMLEAAKLYDEAIKRQQEEKDRKAALIYQQIEEENFIDDIDEGPI